MDIEKDHSEELAGSIAAIGKQVEGFAASTDIQMKDLKAQTETWMQDFERKFADKRGNLRGGDNVLESVPDQYRAVIRTADVAVQQYKSGKREPGSPSACMFAEDAVLKGASALWLQNHLYKLTNPTEFMRRAAWHDKLELALGFGPVEKAAMSELSAGVGGNLVPTIVEAEILRLIADNSIMRPIVRKVPMTTKTHAYPTRNGVFSAAIIVEEGSITDSAPATPFNQSSLTAKKLGCFATVSGELLQDNVVLLADYLATEFSEQIGRLEDMQALEGDGTGNNFTGVFAAAGVNSVTSGANGFELSWTKLASVPYTALEMASRVGARWFLPPAIMTRLITTRADSGFAAGDNAGLVLFLPTQEGFGSGVPPGLIGYPYAVHSGILTNRAVGTGTNRTSMYFGPPNTIIFGDLLGFSIDLNPWSKFSTFQIDIRGVKRTGILVAVPTAWTKYTAIDSTLSMKA